MSLGVPSVRELPATIVLLRVSAGPLERPPTAGVGPGFAVLPVMVLLLMVAVPPAKTPPLAWPKLPETVLLVTVRVPARLFKMPPPWPEAVLPERVQLVTVSVPLAL